MTNIWHNLNCHSRAPDLVSFPYLIRESSIKAKMLQVFTWSLLFNLNILGNYFLYGAVGFSVTFVYLVVSLSVTFLLVYLNTSVISEPEIV